MALHSVDWDLSALQKSRMGMAEEGRERNHAMNIMAEIKAWHLEDRQSTIKRTFALGDLIHKAIIHTELVEAEVIKHIQEDLGELALGTTSYNRAARMARVFTSNQRAVLIDKYVSLEKCEILAGKFYTGRRRAVMIADIKSGKVKSPWQQIAGIYELGGRRRSSQLIEVEREKPDGLNNPDNVVVRIAQHGELYVDGILNGLKCVASRIGPDRFEQLIKQAKRELGWK